MKNKYEILFGEFLSVTEFKLVKYTDGFGLVDLQGANLGDIEGDRFKTAEDIIDRMDVYINDYFLNDIDELLDEKNIEVDWPFTCDAYLEHANELLPEYPWDFEVLDMICNHANEINLENCDYEEE